MQRASRSSQPGARPATGRQVSRRRPAPPRHRRLLAEPLEPRTLLASISGVAFNDLNSNGIFEPSFGERAIGGLTVYLDLNHNGRFDTGAEPTAVSSADGSYSFTGLGPGQYEVGQAAAADWAQVYPAQPSSSIRTLSIGAADILYDPFRKQIYATVAGNDHLEVIDPLTGAVTDSLLVGSNLSQLALSDDGQMLYVATNGGTSIRPVNLATGIAGLEFTLGSAAIYGDYYVDDMAVMPGHPNTLAVARKFSHWSPDHAGVAIYDNGVQRSVTTPGHDAPNLIEFSTTPGILYGYDTENPPYDYYRMAVDGAGVTNVNIVPNLIYQGRDVEYFDGKIYASTGDVVDPDALRLLGGFKRSSGAYAVAIQPDRDLGILLTVNSIAGTRLEAFDQQSYLPVGGPLPMNLGLANYHLISTGRDSLALWSSTGSVYLIDWNPRQPTQGVDLTPSQALTDVNFGSSATSAPSSISGQVYRDANGSGTRDVTESGLAGWTVFLDANGNGQLDAGERTETTDGDGRYQFVGVAPGSYNVITVPKMEAQQTAPAAQEARIRRINLPTNDLVYDPALKRILASVPSSGGVFGNTVAQLEPQTGTVESSVYVGSEPTKLALSSDNQTLYVSLDGAAAVRQLNPATNTPGLQFWPGNNALNGPLYVNDMAVMPGSPNVLAVARSQRVTTGGGGGVAIYDQGVQRPQVPPNGSARAVVEFTGGGGPLYAYDTSNGLTRMTVDSNGIQVTSTTSVGFMNTPDLKYQGGLLYTGNGKVVDPTTNTIIGSYGASGLVQPDTNDGVTYILSGNQLKAFDQSTDALIRSLTISGLSSATSIAQWGPHSLAINSFNGQVFLVEWDPRNPGTTRSQAVYVQAGQAITGADFGFQIANFAPAAANDSLATNEGTPLTIQPADLLTNDADADNDPLTVVIATQPAHGSLTPQADGSFVYTPAPYYSGPDQFTYRASDGQKIGNEATVSITVNFTADGAVAATLVKDINVNPATIAVKGQIIDVNGIAYFEGPKNALWRSDGTSQGTWPLLNDGHFGGGGFWWANVSGTLFFAAADSAGTFDLWKTDGTVAGTVVVRQIKQNAERDDLQFLTNVNGTLFFAADDGIHGKELWKSDGTSDGTVMVKDLDASPASSVPAYLTNVGGTLFFVDRTSDPPPSFPHQLWKSDGTEAGTVAVESGVSPALASEGGLAQLNGKVLFNLTGPDGLPQLWQTDGSPEHAELLKDDASGESFYDLDGIAYFSGWDNEHGEELWKTDGTPDGTVRIKDLFPGNGSGFPTFYYTAFAHLGNEVFFFGRSALTALDLWKTDGTEAGTVLVKTAGKSTSSLPYSLVNVNGKLYFAANDGVSGLELWQSDGSTEGTTLVKDITSGPSSSYPKMLTNAAGKLFFTTGVLNVSDGTAAGTTAIIRGNGSTASSSTTLGATIDGVTYFAAIDGNSGLEVWRTDGTAGGTFLFKDINAGAGSSSPAYFTNVSGTLFFSADDGVHGRRLWQSDGTSAGTLPVGDLEGPLASQLPTNPKAMANVNGKLYFSGTDSALDEELWVSDGTAAGTARVIDIVPGSISSRPRYLTNVSGTLYFKANQPADGDELWTSDGTAGGTVLVKEFAPGTTYSSILSLANVNGNLFFAASDGTTGTELWKSDGTADGTVLVKDINPGSGSSNPAQFVVLGQAVYFVASDNIHGWELWKSDGTAEGTAIVKDIWPGQGTSGITDLVNAEGKLYFWAGDGIHSLSLWQSDGTTAGTIAVAGLQPPAFTGLPSAFVATAGTLLFTADDGFHGREPMMLTSINTPPAFTKGSDVAATDEDGLRTIGAWAGGISSGPAREAGQHMHFVLAVDRPELFAVQPEIDAAGTLTFQPRANASGTVTITISLVDDGGTANGGDDTSPPQTLVIDITKPHAWHNAALPCDVDQDTFIAPGDALAVINYINSIGSGPIAKGAALGDFYYDVDGDQFVAPSDALMVINYINGHPSQPGLPAGEGEAAVDAGLLLYLLENSPDTNARWPRITNREDCNPLVNFLKFGD